MFQRDRLDRLGRFAAALALLLAGSACEPAPPAAPAPTVQPATTAQPAPTVQPARPAAPAPGSPAAPSPATPAAPTPVTPAASAQPGPDGLARRADYQRAKDRARAWLDKLEVDPVDLLKHGVKGKKKLAEILDAYLTLLRHAGTAEERAAVLARVNHLAAQASRDEYHNLLTCGEQELRENSMSYLRVWWLLQRLGLDTTSYAAKVAEAKPRLDAHVATRGPWQQAMFTEYYDRFGLDKPLALLGMSMQAGVIGRRVPAGSYTDDNTYDLTHEVFVAFDYGLRREQNKLSAGDLAHARIVLPVLTRKYLAAGNPDLVGELLSCLTYLGWHGDPEHRQAINFLLDHQNPNGSWGDYEIHRQRFGPYLDHHVYLHTTMVVLNALVEAFQGAWPAAADPPRQTSPSSG